MKRDTLFLKRKIFLPVDQALMVEVIKGSNGIYPFIGPFFQLGEIAGDLQKISAHMHPAISQNDGLIFSGCFLIRAISIDHYYHFGRLKLRKVSYRYCCTARGSYSIENNMKGSGEPEIPTMSNLAGNFGKNVPTAFIVVKKRFAHLVLI